MRVCASFLARLHPAHPHALPAAGKGGLRARAAARRASSERTASVQSNARVMRGSSTNCSTGTTTRALASSRKTRMHSAPDDPARVDALNTQAADSRPRDSEPRARERTRLFLPRQKMDPEAALEACSSFVWRAFARTSHAHTLTYSIAFSRFFFNYFVQARERKGDST